MNDGGGKTGRWIGTNGGRRIYLRDETDLGEINITDIARGLSNTCRFGGQIKRHYSVAQHSIHVAELVPEPYKLQALMHDAPEAYICDVPTPLKQEIGWAYDPIEEMVAGVIGRRFEVDLINLHTTVKVADRIMVVSERDQLQAMPQQWGQEYEDSMRYPGVIPHWTPDYAYEKFMDMFTKYGGGNHGTR